MADKPTFTADDVMLYLLGDLDRLEKIFAELKAKNQDTPAHALELAMFRSVVASFRYVQTDPAGFREFCERTRERYGKYPITGEKPERPQPEGEAAA